MRIVRPATAFSAAPAKGKRRPRQLHQQHLKFIRSLPCCVCGSHSFVEAAHIRMGSAVHGKRETGGGERPSDEWALPLCRHHHQDAPDAQHRIGEEAFWALHGIDPFMLALALWCATGDEDRAEAIINETRARPGGEHG
ncbi:hypothetical protein V5F38_05340 [Xanthobacter sp. V0B-10]|uniref:DUF968 domain-containing protein n=1 Tax=Xanthobacter albus TaxID=3119929 RepID=UPI003727BE00